MEVAATPSAVLSMKATAPGWIGVEGTGSHLLGLSGYLAQIFPCSETCRRCTVPERNEVATLDAGAVPEQDVPAIRPAAPGHHLELGLEPAGQVIERDFNLLR